MQRLKADGAKEYCISEESRRDELTRFYTDLYGQGPADSEMPSWIWSSFDPGELVGLARMDATLLRECAGRLGKHKHVLMTSFWRR